MMNQQIRPILSHSSYESFSQLNFDNGLNLIEPISMFPKNQSILFQTVIEAKIFMHKNFSICAVSQAAPYLLRPAQHHNNRIKSI